MADTTITRGRVDELMRAVFRALLEMDKRAHPKDIFAKIEPRLSLNDHERGTLKTGSIRWETLLRWYSVDCAKAGFLEKSGGYWSLTPKGEEALKLPPGELIRSAQLKYREWRSQRDGIAPQVVADVAAEPDASIEQEKISRLTSYERALEAAREGIENHINQHGPYEFQNLVAELLRGMGYHVPHVSPPGADGGIDLIAYQDPLGTTPPHIKVQVKHREQKATVKEIRELEGLLRRDSDTGLLVSSGGFTADAAREARASHRHIELMDLDRFISLWQDHYKKLRDEGRAMLPLANISFLAPEEE